MYKPDSLVSYKWRFVPLIFLTIFKIFGFIFSQSFYPQFIQMPLSPADLLIYCTWQGPKGIWAWHHTLKNKHSNYGDVVSLLQYLRLYRRQRGLRRLNSCQISLSTLSQRKRCLPRRERHCRQGTQNRG